MEQITQLNTWLTHYALNFGTKVLGAVALWIIGGWCINLIGAATRRGMSAQKVDPTLITYVEAALRVAMRIALVVAILSVFGIETTSFAALIAAAGVAIGAAWSGLLSNFAAGAFLLIFRPFKVGDMITAAGVTGDVVEIGIFGTTLTTADNLRVTVGNGKIFSDNIVNYSANPYRRVELKAQLAHGVDPVDAIQRLKMAVASVPNICATPAPEVEIFEFNASGTQLVVRPFCANKDYWQVYFDTNRVIQGVAAAANWPAPATVQIQYNHD